jgi:tetratricopeptide (TPR) repeat protein
MKVLLFTAALLSCVVRAEESGPMDAQTPERHLASGDTIKRLREASARKDEEGVVQAAVQILGEDAKNLEALNALAVHYYNSGKLGLSKILIQRALNDHQNIPALHNNLGVIFLTEGKQRQAIGEFKRALEIQANYPYASSHLGSIYLEFKDYKKAADSLGVGYEAMRSDLRRGSYAIDIAGDYAVALSGAGDLDRAKDVFKKIMRADDQNPSTLYNYAVLLVARMKDKDEGEKIISKLKLVAPDSMQKRVDDLQKMLSGT